MYRYKCTRRQQRFIPLAIPSHTKIAIALDFSENDQKILSHALGQGNNNTDFILLHVVESVPARIYENESDDLETEKDKEHLIFYAEQLKERGFNAEAMIGFGNRAKEIVRIVTESGADMLVIGAHGHSGIKDFIYGETINSVRHELKIPVLIVNL
ncbi:MAG: universal stress protein [Chitinophagaceae bacterium]